MSLNTPFRPDHLDKANALVEETQANNGLAPIDLELFWSDQVAAQEDPFADNIPQVPFGATLTGECVYDELGIPVDFWRYQHDEAWRIAINKQYNDKAQKIVGRRILSEQPQDPSLQYPPVKGLNDVFEAENVWSDQSWWLLQSAHDETELEALLDRVEACDVRACILPDNWQHEKKRLMKLGVKPPLYRGQRGPVTFAASIYGPEPLILLILDNPDLADRFRDAILDTMLEIARILDEEAGYTPENAPRGFGFADDNCCLLTPAMYERFGYPILKGMFDRYAPDPQNRRGQHSDSPMAHLLPILGRLDMTRLNLGPTVRADDIRTHNPNAVIDGQLAPFTYSRNEGLDVVLEFLRDFEMTRDKRGLNFTTAGSVNNGTRLTTMRLAMAAIQKFGRYNS